MLLNTFYGKTWNTFYWKDSSCTIPHENLDEKLWLSLKRIIWLNRKRCALPTFYRQYSKSREIVIDSRLR